MTEAEQRHAQQKEIALRDLGDIEALRKHEPFLRYFVRRMNERHDVFARAFKYDKVDATEREVLRQLVLEYEAIAGMMGTDEKGCRKMIEAVPSDTRALAGTHGNG